MAAHVSKSNDHGQVIVWAMRNNGNKTLIGSFNRETRDVQYAHLSVLHVLDTVNQKFLDWLLDFITNGAIYLEKTISFKVDDVLWVVMDILKTESSTGFAIVQSSNQGIRFLYYTTNYIDRKACMNRYSPNQNKETVINFFGTVLRENTGRLPDLKQERKTGADQILTGKICKSEKCYWDNIIEECDTRQHVEQLVDERVLKPGFTVDTFFGV